MNGLMTTKFRTWATIEQRDKEREGERNILFNYYNHNLFMFFDTNSIAREFEFSEIFRAFYFCVKYIVLILID